MWLQLLSHSLLVLHGNVDSCRRTSCLPSQPCENHRQQHTPGKYIAHDGIMVSGRNKPEVSMTSRCRPPMLTPRLDACLCHRDGANTLSIGVSTVRWCKSMYGSGKLLICYSLSVLCSLSSHVPLEQVSRHFVLPASLRCESSRRTFAGTSMSYLYC